MGRILSRTEGAASLYRMRLGRLLFFSAPFTGLMARPGIYAWLTETTAPRSLSSEPRARQGASENLLHPPDTLEPEKRPALRSGPFFCSLERAAQSEMSARSRFQRGEHP
jgi:hypothetical protein